MDYEQDGFNKMDGFTVNGNENKKRTRKKENKKIRKRENNKQTKAKHVSFHLDNSSTFYYKIVVIILRVSFDSRMNYYSNLKLHLIYHLVLENNKLM